MKHLLPRLCLGLFGAGLAAHAQIPVAHVEAIENSVYVLVGANDTEKKITVVNDSWLWSGAKVECPAGSVITLKYDGEAKPEKHVGPETFRVRVVDGPPAAKNVPAMLRIAARPHAGNALLLAPESANFIPGRPITLHWLAPKEISEVLLSVSVTRGPVIWKQRYPAADGAATPPELPELLQREIASGKDRFRVSCSRVDAQGVILSSTLTALTPEKEKELENELSGCGSPAHPWYPLLRAATFLRFELYDDAMRELEIILAKPKLSRDPQLQEIAATVFEVAGQAPRAALLRQSAQVTPAH